MTEKGWKEEHSAEKIRGKKFLSSSSSFSSSSSASFLLVMTGKGRGEVIHAENHFSSLVLNNSKRGVKIGIPNISHELLFAN